VNPDQALSRSGSRNAEEPVGQLAVIGKITVFLSTRSTRAERICGIDDDGSAFSRAFMPGNWGGPEEGFERVMDELGRDTPC